jgi:uncharacterized NAD-dependent epimerase/dehydratase family protein
MALKRPYLMFLGDAVDQLAAKTAQGVVDWRRDWCVGQHSLAGCNATLGLPDMSIDDAVAAGAKTVIVGVANRGGVIGESWIDTLREALEKGLDLASGLHQRLADAPALKQAAEANGRSMVDARHPTRTFSIGNGMPRAGKRLLTVGTDVSVGKMYTSLSIERELRHRGVAADFRATGQTGIFIAGDGVSVDAVVSDFVSGATEWLCPENDPDHWDVVEGQGSLFHPSYAGVTLGLIHGAQPDALVLCHEPTREHMRGAPGRPLPDLVECMAANQAAARVTNPGVRGVGVSLNTSALSDAAAERALKETEDRLSLPCVDPVRGDVGAIVDRLEG